MGKNLDHKTQKAQRTVLSVLSGGQGQTQTAFSHTEDPWIPPPNIIETYVRYKLSPLSIDIPDDRGCVGVIVGLEIGLQAPRVEGVKEAVHRFALGDVESGAIFVIEVLGEI